jgi:hypothetical protein
VTWHEVILLIFQNYFLMEKDDVTLGDVAYYLNF